MKRDRILTVLSFAAIYIVWGSTYLAIRYAVMTIPPLLVATIRHFLSGSALFVIAFAQGHRTNLRQWRAAAVLGVLFFLIGHGTLHWAETLIPSGLAALLLATEPVWLAALDFRKARSRTTILGILLGLAGVAMLMRDSLWLGTRQFVAAAVVILGTGAWSLGMIYSRNATLHPSPVMRSGMSMLCGSLFLFAGALATGEVAAFRPSGVTLPSILGIAYLVTFGSLTYAAYMWLLARISPIVISTHTYVNPVIAVLLGSMFAHEPLGLRTFIAGAVVIGAVALVSRD